MYIPVHFQMEDEEVTYSMIDENGFATLISQHQGAPFATHLPLMLDHEKKCLYGHFARPNPQWKEIAGQQVLAIFMGPHCYISPSWYETHTAVPTWNYEAVHVYGQVELLEDEQELMDSLRQLVWKYEDRDSSYRLDEVDSSFIQGMTKAIVGFKINIHRIEGKAKLSQNHPIERQELIIQQLKQNASENTQKVADRMKENLLKKS